MKITDPNEKDLSTYVTKVKQKKPDIVFLNLLETQIVPFVKKAKEQGLNVPLVHIGGVRINETTRPILQGTYVADVNISDEVREKYKAEYGSDSDIAPSTQTAYDAVSLIGEALKSGARTSEEIAEYVKSVEDFEGITGLLNFDVNGFAQWPEDIVEVNEIE